MQVIKRDGTVVAFDIQKIHKALDRANTETIKSKQASRKKLYQISELVVAKLEGRKTVNVDEINNLIEDELICRNYNELVRAFIRYRHKKELMHKANTTDESILSLIDLKNEDLKTENSNKNATLSSTQRDYMAGEVSKDISRRIILPKDIVEAHDNGAIHFHDMDYFAQHIHNCDLIDLENMLTNGTVISGTLIEKPHSFSTACNIATQIIAQVASSQYGGQSVSLAHLAPFVNVSRQKYLQTIRDDSAEFRLNYTEEQIKDLAEKRVKEEIKRGVQTIQYQINTLQTTNGQTPFVTVFMYLNECRPECKADLALIIEEALRQRFEGVKNEAGAYITPAFPKLIYVLEEDNIYQGSEYFYLTKLAAKCSAKRLVPDYISEKVMKELKGGHCFPVMGCRSALSVWPEQPDKFYGRFNKGVVTINLPDVACAAKGDNYNKDMKSFWKIFDDRLELCHKALLERYKRLRGTVSDVAPILWQHGALARLDKGETIDKLLVGGYSTISLGYAGLWECVKELTGETLLTESGQALGLEIMKYMNEKCDEWNKEKYLGFGIYGTPLESTTYKFAKALKKKYGEIEGVSDRDYITNSYHVHVTAEIDPFEKLDIESKFQRLSTGGAISYIETSNLTGNLEAVLEVIRYIYDHIMYAELNTKSDYCQCCGFDGEIKIIKDSSGKLVWECPNCGNRDQDKLNVARRTCGYIGANFWNPGRTAEIQDRFVHLDIHEDCCK